MGTFRNRASSRLPGLSIALLALIFWACGGAGSDGSGDGAAPDEETAAEASPEEAEASVTVGGIPAGGIRQWVDDIRAGLDEVRANPADARSRVIELYVGRQEYIEMYYGPNGELTGADHPELGEAVRAQEALFHDLMGLTGAAVDSPAAGGSVDGGTGRVAIPEIRAVLSELDAAREAYHAGEGERALALLERAYLEGFEPLESRLPGPNVQRVERQRGEVVTAG